MITIRNTSRSILISLSLIFTMFVPTTTQAVSAGMHVARPTLVTFFVSPLGNDTWSGRSATRDKNNGPFATIARARDAIRALRHTHAQPRPVRVAIRGGTYYLDQPLEFGAAGAMIERALAEWQEATSRETAP